MRIDKVKWITAHNCGKPKLHSFTPSLSWKGKIVSFDIVSQKCALGNKLSWTKIADLGIIFFRRSYLIHLYQLLHPQLWEVCRSVFFGPPCIFQCVCYLLIHWFNRVKVFCEGEFLHHILEGQFLDSPEWDSYEKNEKADVFQVSILSPPSLLDAYLVFIFKWKGGDTKIGLCLPHT